MYLFISGWLYSVMGHALYLSLALAFFYLADFGFESRTYRVRPADSQAALDTNLNSSNSVGNAEEFLLEGESADAELRPTNEASEIEKVE